MAIPDPFGSFNPLCWESTLCLCSDPSRYSQIFNPLHCSGNSYIGFNCSSVYPFGNESRKYTKKAKLHRNNLYTIEHLLNMITKHFSFLINKSHFMMVKIINIFERNYLVLVFWKYT